MVTAFSWYTAVKQLSSNIEANIVDLLYLTEV